MAHGWVRVCLIKSRSSGFPDEWDLMFVGAILKILSATAAMLALPRQVKLDR